MSKDWNNVSRESPCPVCGKTDWCTVGARFVHCMRMESERTCEGGGWLHRKDADEKHAPSTPISAPKVSDEVMRNRWTPIALAAEKSGIDRLPQLAVQLGVSVESLRKLHVGYANLQGSWCWTFPERNARGWIVGIQRRLVAPKEGHRDKLCAKGSRRGLTYCDDWHQYPGPIWIVEGGSDVAAGITIGWCVVGRLSNIGGLRQLAELLHAHRKRKMIVVAERDKKPKLYVQQMQPPHDAKCRCCNRCWPGLYGARQLAHQLSKRLGSHVVTRFAPNHAKDLREYVQKQGPLQ